jgi:hypothetical protein
MDYCPSGWTEGSSPKSCTAGEFGVSAFCTDFSSFTGPWTTGDVEASGTGIYPAIWRGQYFEGSTARIEFNTSKQLKLNYRFVIFTWLRLDNGATGINTIFGKYDSSNNLKMQIYLNANYALVVDFKHEGGSTDADGFTTTNGFVTTKEWSYLQITFEDETTTTTTCKFSRTDSTGAKNETGTTNNYFWLDHVDGYPTSIGAMKKSGSTTFSDYFKGFIYSFCLYNSKANSSDKPYSEAAKCDTNC